MHSALTIVGLHHLPVELPPALVNLPPLVELQVASVVVRQLGVLPGLVLCLGVRGRGGGRGTALRPRHWRHAAGRGVCRAGLVQALNKAPGISPSPCGVRSRF